MLANPQVTAAAGAALGFVGSLIASAASDAVKDGLKDLVARIWRQNAGKPKVQKVVIDAGNGVVVTCQMESGGMDVTVQRPGAETTVRYADD